MSDDLKPKAAQIPDEELEMAAGGADDDQIYYDICIKCKNEVPAKRNQSWTCPHCGNVVPKPVFSLSDRIN